MNIAAILNCYHVCCRLALPFSYSVVSGKLWSLSELEFPALNGEQEVFLLWVIEKLK